MDAVGHLPIKSLMQLAKRRGRDEHGAFLIEGKKMFAEALAAKVPIRQVLATSTFIKDNGKFLAEHEFYRHKLTEIADHNAQRLSGTTTPAGIFAVVEQPKLKLADLLTEPLIVWCDDIRDPGNLGTMIRTADWFGVKAMACYQGVDPYHDKVVRATMGSLFHVRTYATDNIEDLVELKNAGYKIVVTQPESSTQLSQIQHTSEKICLVLGNESHGTSPKIDRLADATCAIPKYGQAESLNVAVSFGIFLHQLSAGDKTGASTPQ